MANYRVMYRFKDKNHPHYDNGYWYLQGWVGTMHPEVKQSDLNIELRILYDHSKNKEYKFDISPSIIIMDEKPWKKEE